MSQPRFGSQTLASVGLSLLVIVGAFLAIRPRFSEGRLRLDNKHLLTPVEVQAIPDGVLPVVLGRDLGDTEREFKTQLLRLIMERSGVDFAFGLTAEDLSQDAAVDALASGQLVGDKNPHAITIGVYGAGRALNARLRVIPIPITGGVLGLRVGWTHDMRLPRLASVDHLNDLWGSPHTSHWADDKETQKAIATHNEWSRLVNYVRPFIEAQLSQVRATVNVAFVCEYGRQASVAAAELFRDYLGTHPCRA